MIKKLITSAAIIAASTALANAATFTYDSSAITDAANSAISVSGTSGSGYGSYTVTLVLDADAFVSAVADGTGVTFASVQGSGGAQFSYGTYTDTTNALGLGWFTYGTTSPFSYAPTSGTLSDGSTLVNGTEQETTVNLSTGLAEAIADLDIVSAVLSATISSSGVYYYLTYVTSDSIVTTISGYNSGAKFASYGTLATLYLNSSYVTYAVLEESYTNDIATMQETNLSVLAASIPEPSAFGLLTGVGALALVASRRRRKA